MNESNENIITQELYDANPQYAEAGLNVRDAIPQKEDDSVEYEDFVVTREFLDENPGLIAEIGETVKVAKASMVPEVPSKSEDEKETEAVEPTVVKTYNGQEVISDGYRIVDDRKIRHIRVVDGSAYDLSEDDYQKDVKAA